MNTLRVINDGVKEMVSMLLVLTGLLLTTIAEGFIRTGAWIVDVDIEEII